jgi:hypothetical protein
MTLVKQFQRGRGRPQKEKEPAEESRMAGEYSGKGSVPDMETGFCLGSVGNGASLGEGSEGWPGPPERVKDKQSMHSKGEDNLGKNEEEQLNQT